MNQIFEKDLIEKAKCFDQACLSEIYDLYNHALFRYALRLLGDENLAEDCVADTFLRFLKALKANKGPDSFLQAYLFRTAHNWITDFYRRKTPIWVEIDEKIAVQENSSEEKIELDNEISVTKKALTMLKQAQREAIILKYLEGYENAEIARMIGKNVGATKALINRASTNLKRNIRNLELENGSKLIETIRKIRVNSRS